VATVRLWEYVQTMGRQAPTVVFPEVIASVIVIEIW
jgi:glycine cleavage system protein P-like pyridoxal-binding family